MQRGREAGLGVPRSLVASHQHQRPAGSLSCSPPSALESLLQPCWEADERLLCPPIPVRAWWHQPVHKDPQSEQQQQQPREGPLQPPPHDEEEVRVGDLPTTREATAPNSFSRRVLLVMPVEGLVVVTNARFLFWAHDPQFAAADVAVEGPAILLHAMNQHPEDHDEEREEGDIYADAEEAGDEGGGNLEAPQGVSAAASKEVENPTTEYTGGANHDPPRHNVIYLQFPPNDHHTAFLMDLPSDHPVNDDDDDDDDDDNQEDEEHEMAEPLELTLQPYDQSQDHLAAATASSTLSSSSTATQNCRVLFQALSELVSLHPILPHGEDDNGEYDNDDDEMNHRGYDHPDDDDDLMVWVSMDEGPDHGYHRHPVNGGDDDEDDDDHVDDGEYHHPNYDDGKGDDEPDQVPDHGEASEEERQAMLERLDRLLIVPPELEIADDDGGDDEVMDHDPGQVGFPMNNHQASHVPRPQGQFDDAEGDEYDDPLL